MLLCSTMEMKPLRSRFGEKTQFTLNKLEAYVFANAGMPGRFVRSTGLLLRAAMVLPEEDASLTVALPTAILPRSERSLLTEADRLEHFFDKIDTPADQRPSIASPEAIANMRCMGEAIGVYYEHHVGALAMVHAPRALPVHA